MQDHGSNGANATIIDADVEFHGTLKIKGGKQVCIRGLVDGQIESNGDLVIETGGVVRGAITTKNLTVSGQVETDQVVEIRGLLSVEKGGVLTASKIIYGNLSLATGARLTGQLEPGASSVDESEVVRPAHSMESRKPSSALGQSLSSILNHPGVPVVPVATPSINKLPFLVDEVVKGPSSNLNEVRELEKVG